MSKPRLSLLMAVLALAASASPSAGAEAGAPLPESPHVAVRPHVAEARAAAGHDLKQLLTLCLPARPERLPQPVVDVGVPLLIHLPAPAPARVFDDLYYVGGLWASAWALRTSEGVILIDALNNADEAARLIEGGMARLDVQPRQIRYIVITHGHGDHYGGARYLAKGGALVAMTEEDWSMARDRPEFTSASWDPVPDLDLKLKPGDTLSLGAQNVAFHGTPGHTLGTLSLVFPVRHAGREHKALLWGGLAFNFGKDVERLDAYIRATEEMSRVVAREGIDVFLTNHPFSDGTLWKLRQLGERADSGHPFVIGNEAVLRALRVMRACAREQRDRFTMQP